MTELDNGRQLFRGIYPKALEYNGTYLWFREAHFAGNGGKAAIEYTYWLQHWRNDTQDNWLRGSILVTGVYLFVVLGLQQLMVHRKPVQANAALMAWNVANALLAAVGTARCAGEFFNAIGHGFETSVCYSVSIHTAAAYWHGIFAYSKLFELGDTVFLVLRKRPLTLLHVYHHASVIVATWFSGAEHNGAARWYILMNYFVHAFMYTYFALKAYGARISRLGSMCLTLMQISQFIVGLVICYVVYVAKTEGRQCQHSWRNWSAILLMYFSYFVLFMRFFVRSYLRRKPADDSEIKRSKAQ